MHVAILIGRFPPSALGGAEWQAENWAKRLVDRHRVTVITRAADGVPAGHETRDGFAIVRLPIARLPLWRTVADVNGIERTLASLTPKPDVTLCFQTFVSGLAGVRAGRRLGIPAIVWIRGEDEYQLGRSRVNRVLSPLVWSGARAVLVQSEQNRLDLLREVETYAPAALAGVKAKLDVVANGLDLPQGPFAPGTRLLSVGRLIPDKCMDVVIDAAAACGLPLTIAGTGREREALEQRARAAGGDCRFEGFVGRERIAELYRDATCVMLVARRGEGLPNVLLEAMSYARPVIATPCAGTRDLVVDGVNGLVVPPGDPPALRAALARLARDPELAARLGAEARCTVARYAWERVRPRLETVLAGGRPGAEGGAP